MAFLSRLAARLPGGRKTSILILTVLLVSLVMLVPLPFSASAAQARTIDIQARRFAYAPATVQVQRGDTVTLKLEAMDAVHGLAVDGYDVDIQAEPGHSAQVTFVADKEGKYKFRCSVSCGALHPFMIGEMQVSPEFPLARGIVATVIASLFALGYFWK